MSDNFFIGGVSLLFGIISFFIFFKDIKTGRTHLWHFLLLYEWLEGPIETTTRSENPIFYWLAMGAIFMASIFFIACAASYFLIGPPYMAIARMTG